MADSLLRLIFQGDTTDAKKAIGGLKDSFGELKDFAVGLLAGISFAKIIKESYDLGVMLSETKVKIQTAIGDSGELLEDTLGITRDLFKTTDVTFGQATDMMVIFRNTMGLTNDEINEQKDAWEDWMDITGRGPEILSATDQMMRALNVDTFAGKKEILDWTLGIQRVTPIALDPLMSALTSTAPLMSAFGMSTKEQIAFLGFMTSAGLDAGSATMMFNQAIRNVKTPAELYEMMDTIKNTTDDLEAAQIASDVFGARGGAKLAAALRSGKMGIDELVASLDKSTGAFDAAGKAVAESYGEKLGIMKNKLADIGMTIGEGLVTAAMPIVDWITSTAIPAVGSFMDMFQTGLDWIKKGWDALPEPVQQLIPILGGLGIAFVALKTIMIGHPLILMATILAGAVIGIGKFMDSLVPVEDKWKAIARAAFDAGQETHNASVVQVGALEQVQGKLSSLARMQNEIQTADVIQQERLLIDEINKLNPALQLVIDDSGRLSSAYGDDIEAMKGKTDELIQKIKEIQTADQAQAEAKKASIESEINLLDTLIARKELVAKAAYRTYTEEATKPPEEQDPKKAAELLVKYQGLNKEISDLKDKIIVLRGELAGVNSELGSDYFAVFEEGMLKVVAACDRQWEPTFAQLQQSFPTLTAALQTETGNMVKAMWDSGFSLEEATSAAWQKVYDAAILGGANQKVAAELASAAVLTVWQNNGQDLAKLAKTNAISAATVFAESIYDGLADKAPLVAQAVQYVSDMLTINDAYSLGQTITSEWVAGMVSILDSDTRLSRGVTRVEDLFGHSLPDWAKNIYSVGQEISSTWVAGIAAGMSEDTKIATAIHGISSTFTAGMSEDIKIAHEYGASFAAGIAAGISEDTKIARAMAEVSKQLMPGGVLPGGGTSGGPYDTGIPGLNPQEATYGSPIPMPADFPYWNELVSYLKTSWPRAQMGQPMVSQVRTGGMYQTGTTWTDPGGKNWTIYPWGYAEGGLVTKPTWAPIAEREPEYVTSQGKLDSLLAAILEALERLGGINRFDQHLSVEVEAGPGSLLELAAKGLRIRG